MKKMVRNALSMLLVLVMLAAAMPALAEEAAVADGLYGLTIDDVVLKSGPATIDLGVRLEMLAGMDAAQERALMNFALLVGEKGAKALELFGAIEDGDIKAYAQNDGGGLPYFIQIPLEDWATVFEDLGELGSSGEEMDLITELITNYMAAVMSLQEDPEKALAVSEAFSGVIELTDAGTHQIEMFGESIEAQAVSAQFTLLELVEATEAVYHSTPEFEALFDSYQKMLEQSGTSWEEAVEELSDPDEAATIDMTMYMADEYVRVAVDVLKEDTSEQATMNFDMYMGESNGKFVMDFLAPDEAPVHFAMEIDDQSTSENGVDTTALSVQVVADSEDEAFELYFDLNGTSEEATGAKAFELSLIADTDDGRYGVTLQYDGVVSETGSKGSVALAMQEGGETLGELSFTLETSVGQMPEGALMTMEGLESINPLTADAEQLEELELAMETLMGNALMTLMQSPALAEIMGGAMGGSSDGLDA